MWKTTNNWEWDIPSKLNLYNLLKEVGVIIIVKQVKLSNVAKLAYKLRHML